MTSSYPGAIVSTPSRNDADMSAATTHEDWHDIEVEEIRAIQTELGLTPSGAYSTVKDRLDDMTALCQVRRASAQSVMNNTPTLILFNTTDLDVLGWHDGGGANPERVTPTIAGWYRVTFSTDWQSDTDYTRINVNVLKNGAATTPLFSVEQAFVAATFTPNLSGSTPLIELNGTTDFINLQCTQVNTSTGTQTVDPAILVELVLPT